MCNNYTFHWLQLTSLTRSHIRVTAFTERGRRHTKMMTYIGLVLYLPIHYPLNLSFSGMRHRELC